MTLTTLITSVGNLLNSLVPILIALALLAFFWGIFRYVWGAGGEASKVDGKKIMLAGLLGLFVMLSVWGIIRIAQSSLGISGTEEATVPKVPNPSSSSGGSYNTTNQTSDPWLR